MLVKNFSSNFVFNLGRRSWFISLLIAQAVFVAYLIMGYGFSTLKLNPENWNTYNQSAFESGDTVGNLFYGIHVLFAIFMIAGGSLQLIPQVRNRFTTFHRINGRIYVTLACLISLAGMYLIIFRGTVGDPFLHAMTFFSGIVVIVSSFFAVKMAMNKRISVHREWAIRLFLAANGVLFFRLFIFAWFMTFGSLGVNTKDFTGPTVYAVSICSYLLPLLIFELYRIAKNSPQQWLKNFTGSFLMAVACVYLIGLFSITLGNWYPSVMASL